MTSVERIKAYSDLKLEDDVDDPVDPGSQWPERGSIEFKDVCLTYETSERDLQPALKNLNLKIEHGEKVCIECRGNFTYLSKQKFEKCIFRYTKLVLKKL